ncbi:MAG: methyltransferase domain-containing protein [Sneathiella sp.]|nr:methyltransferase domain-containing protein [Sneathiella sp.]
MEQITPKSLQRVEKLAQNAIKQYKRNNSRDARKSVSKLVGDRNASIMQLFQTGLAAYNAGDTEAALKLHDKAMTLPEKAPVKHSDILLSRGVIKNSISQGKEAINDYNQALSLAPNDPRILNNRAIALRKSGDLEAAQADVKQALTIDPQNANALLNLATILKELGKPEELTPLISKHIQFHQNNADVYLAAGDALVEKKPLEALTYYRKAAHLQPKSARILNTYANVFTRLASLRNFDGLDQDLLLLLSNDQVEWKKLNWLIPQHLKSLPDFQALLPALTKGVNENRDVNLDYGQVVKCMTNNVMLAAIKRIRLSDPLLEKLLEVFRRQTLAALSSDLQLDETLKSVLLSILLPFAKYSFMSEYIFSENDFELKMVENLRKDLGKAPDYNLDNALKFTILCCYVIPYREESLKKCVQKWQKTEIHAFNELVEIVITEPEREQASISKIPKLTEINDAISLSVREQYEENPYPRWDHFPDQGSTTIGQHLANILPSLHGITPNLPKQPLVLIAGCGTGRQPISTSLAFPDAKITAVDLSLASIAYAKRKTEELKISNISYGQADIMELKSLGKKFNIIECGGVLHHMHDPLEGWKVLVDILEDDGFMMIALYSEIGRRDIVAARKFVEENGYASDVQGIRACRKQLLALSDGNIAKAVCRQLDFYTTSACRDLIFHVQEHRFTVQGLEAAFDKLGLEFLGFTLAGKQHEEAYKRSYPEDKEMTNLQNWAAFEEANPDTFSAMYKFWVKKKR